MAHKLPPLRFGYDALEPYIDAETMDLHHDKHHATYVDNLNKALESYPHLAERTGGYILAVSHISHLEPFIATSLVKRKIDWMARVEFYRWRIFRPFLRAFDTFPVNRFGVPVSSIRTAINRAKSGRVVGIFPEGGVVQGKDSACRGGPIKRGACLVAMRANVPIVPPVC